MKKSLVSLPWLIAIGITEFVIVPIYGRVLGPILVVLAVLNILFQNQRYSTVIAKVLLLTGAMNFAHYYLFDFHVYGQGFRDYSKGPLFYGPALLGTVQLLWGMASLRKTNEYAMGIGLILLAFVNFVQFDITGIIIGGIFLVPGVMTLAIRRRPMFVVNAIALLLVGGMCIGDRYDFWFWDCLYGVYLVWGTQQLIHFIRGYRRASGRARPGKTLQEDDVRKWRIVASLGVLLVAGVLIYLRAPQLWRYMSSKPAAEETVLPILEELTALEQPEPSWGLVDLEVVHLKLPLSLLKKGWVTGSGRMPLVKATFNFSEFDVDIPNLLMTEMWVEHVAFMTVEKKKARLGMSLQEERELALAYTVPVSMGKRDGTLIVRKIELQGMLYEGASSIVIFDTPASKGILQVKSEEALVHAHVYAPDETRDLTVLFRFREAVDIVLVKQILASIEFKGSTIESPESMVELLQERVQALKPPGGS